MKLARPEYKLNYPQMMDEAKGLTSNKRRALYSHMALNDMYFLLKYACHLPSYVIDHPFCVERCSKFDEYWARPQGLDNLFSFVFREGMKSLIFNYGANIRSILTYPEDAGCIFSYNNPAAKDFLKPVKRTLESSDELKNWFPHILYADPRKECKEGWSVDGGIVVKRKSNRKEPTLMPAGLVDSQPTRMHFNNRCYDDVVTEENTRTKYMMDETLKQFENSDNLGTAIPNVRSWAWGMGTFYRYNDPYSRIKDKGVYDIEVVPCVFPDEDGKHHLNCEPRFHSVEDLKLKLIKQGRYVFNCQMMLDPVPDADRKFDIDKMSYYDRNNISPSWRYILLCDPANTEKGDKRGHNPDYTAMWVVAIDQMGNEYLVDGVYDRIKSTDAIQIAFDLIQKYGIRWVSWEKVGAQGDTQWINYMKSAMHCSFELNEFSPNGYGGKQDRIEKALLGRIESGRLKFPYQLNYRQRGGKIVDLIGVLKEELKDHPFARHDDFADCGAQLLGIPQWGAASIDTSRVDPKVPFEMIIKNSTQKGRNSSMLSKYI